MFLHSQVFKNILKCSEKLNLADEVGEPLIARLLTLMNITWLPLLWCFFGCLNILQCLVIRNSTGHQTVPNLLENKPGCNQYISLNIAWCFVCWTKMGNNSCNYITKYKLDSQHWKYKKEDEIIGTNPWSSCACCIIYMRYKLENY